MIYTKEELEEKFKDYFVYLDGLTSAEGLNIPDNFKGTLNLDGLTSAEGLNIPDNFKGTLYLNGLTSAEGLNISDNFNGRLYLNGLTSAEGLNIPNNFKGALNLNGLTSVAGLNIPDSFNGWLYLNGLTKTDGLELPEDFDMSQIYMPENLKKQYIEKRKLKDNSQTENRNHITFIEEEPLKNETSIITTPIIDYGQENKYANLSNKLTRKEIFILAAKAIKKNDFDLRIRLEEIFEENYELNKKEKIFLLEKLNSVVLDINQMYENVLVALKHRASTLEELEEIKKQIAQVYNYLDDTKRQTLSFYISELESKIEPIITTYRVNK